MTITPQTSVPPSPGKAFPKRLIIVAILFNLLLAIFAGTNLYHQRSQDEMDTRVTTGNICQILEQNRTSNRERLLCFRLEMICVED